MGGLEQEGPIRGTEQQILHLDMGDGVQFPGAVEVEGRAEGHPDEEHDPRLKADARRRVRQGEHGEAEDGGQPPDDGHGLAPAGLGDAGEGGDVAVGGHAREKIGQCGTHSGHVDDPVEGRTTEPRGDEGQGQREEHGVGRGAVFGMDAHEPRVQELGAAHAEQQARGRHEEAVHARKDARHDRDGEDGPAELAEGHVRHRAGGPAMVLAEQIGIGHDHGDGEKHERVEQCAAADGVEHEAAGFFRREVEFLGGLGDGVEAHEEPRRDGEDGNDAGPRGTPFREEGEKVFHMGGFGGHAACGQHEHAAGQGKGEDELEAARHVHAPEVHVAEEEEKGRHHDQFARIDVPSCHRVEVAHVEDAGQDEAAEQGQRGTVGRDDAEVAERQRPAADEARPRPEADVGVGEGAARHGIDLDEDAVAQGHGAEQAAAEGKGDDGPERPGLGQEARARQHEAAPSDDGPDRQCPDFGGAHCFFEFFSFRLVFRRVGHGMSL